MSKFSSNGVNLMGSAVAFRDQKSPLLGFRRRGFIKENFSSLSFKAREVGSLTCILLRHDLEGFIL